MDKILVLLKYFLFVFIWAGEVLFWKQRKQLKEMIFFMAKMKYWNGNAWETLDANDADTIDGKHFTDIQNDAQSRVNDHANVTASLSTLGHVKCDVLTAILDPLWSGSSVPYTKTVTVNGILATDTPIIDIVLTGGYIVDKMRIEAWGYIYRAVTDDDSITFYATEKPTISLPIQIKVVR